MSSGSSNIGERPRSTYPGLCRSLVVTSLSRSDKVRKISLDLLQGTSIVSVLDDAPGTRDDGATETS